MEDLSSEHENIIENTNEKKNNETNQRNILSRRINLILEYKRVNKIKSNAICKNYKYFIKK